KHLRLTEMREKVKVLFDYKKLTENQVALEKDLQKKKQEWDKRKTTYTTLENTWLNNQASMLASHLHNGEACPVCGSHEHPEKATEQAGSVTKEQLETVKTAFNEAVTQYPTAVFQFSINELNLTEEEFCVTAHSVSPEEGSTVETQLVEAVKKLKAEVDKLEASKIVLVKLKETYVKAKQQF